MAATRPARGWSVAVIALSGLVTATVALQALTAEGYADGLRSVARGEQVSGAFVVGTAAAIAQIALLVASLVVTGLWMLRLRRFSERVDPRYAHSRRRWWAFGGWVVPIVSFWFPVQYLRDLRDSLRPSTSPSYGWWWAAWLALIVVGRYVGNLGDTGAELRQLPAALTAQAVVFAVALALWVRVVLHLERCARDVPDHVLAATAYEADPHAYDPRVSAPGQPIYGPTGAGAPTAGTTPVAPVPPPPPGPPPGPAPGPGAG